MMYGSKPSDGGNFLMDEAEKKILIKKNPLIEKFIRPFVNAQEFLHNENRYCLWLVDAKPNELSLMPEVLQRIELVRKFREESKAESTRNYKFHTLFRQVTQPKSDYILIPSTTSERRKYIPFGFLSKDVILSNASFSIENSEMYHFGVLMSSMHMAWVKTVCGRLKSDFRYSKDIVYNNFPWPLNPSIKAVELIEIKAKKILEIRASFSESSLANLYDSLTMPSVLQKAHTELDKAVDVAYRPQTFTNDAKRMEFLFELYEIYTADLFTKQK